MNQDAVEARKEQGTERPAPPEIEPHTPDTPGVIDALARYPGNTIFTLEAVARIFGRSPKSIYRATRAGQLPPPVRLFGRASWTAGSILTHLQNRLEQAQRQADKEARRLAQLSA
jgi:predicted DNA-binding transcriptional regulator AlpA